MVADDAAASPKTIARYAPYLARKRAQFAALERLLRGVEPSRDRHGAVASDGSMIEKLDAALLQEVDFLADSGFVPMKAMYNLLRARFVEMLTDCGFALINLNKQAAIVFRLATLAPVAGHPAPEGLFLDDRDAARAVAQDFTVRGVRGVDVQLISAHLELEKDYVNAFFALHEQNRERGFVTCLGGDLNRAQNVQEVALIGDWKIPSVVHKTLALPPAVGPPTPVRSLRQGVLRLTRTDDGTIARAVLGEVDARFDGFVVGDTHTWLQGLALMPLERRTLHLPNPVDGTQQDLFVSDPLTYDNFLQLQRAANSWVLHGRGSFSLSRFLASGTLSRFPPLQQPPIAPLQQQVLDLVRIANWERMKIESAAFCRLTVTEVAVQRLLSSPGDAGTIRMQIESTPNRAHDVDPGRLWLRKQYRAAFSQWGSVDLEWRVDPQHRAVQFPTNQLAETPQTIVRAEPTPILREVVDDWSAGGTRFVVAVGGAGAAGRAGAAGGAAGGSSSSEDGSRIYEVKALPEGATDPAVGYVGLRVGDFLERRWLAALQARLASAEPCSAVNPCGFLLFRPAVPVRIDGAARFPAVLGRAVPAVPVPAVLGA